MESGLLHNIGQRFLPRNSCFKPKISGLTQVYVSRAPMLFMQFRPNNSTNLFIFASHSIYTWLSQPGLLKRQNKGHWAKYKKQFSKYLNKYPGQWLLFNMCWWTSSTPGLPTEWAQYSFCKFLLLHPLGVRFYWQVSTQIPQTPSSQSSATLVLRGPL